MTSTAETNSPRLVSLVCAILLITATAFAQAPSHGPAKGYLLITGGITQPRDYQRLIDMAGGKNAQIVIFGRLTGRSFGLQQSFSDRRDSDHRVQEANKLAVAELSHDVLAAPALGAGGALT